MTAANRTRLSIVPAEITEKTEKAEITETGLGAHCSVDTRFRDALDSLMVERQISQKKLAPQVPMARSYLSEIMSGRKAPSKDMAWALDGALAAGGSLAALVADERPHQQPQPLLAAEPRQVPGDVMVVVLVVSATDVPEQVSQLVDRAAQQGQLLVAGEPRAAIASGALPAPVLISSASVRRRRVLRRRDRP